MSSTRTNKMQSGIGLALSGGGIRAAVFHLGVIARLADSELLEEISFISTVSGGSLCTGLIYGANGYQWPQSKEFRSSIVPSLRAVLTENNLFPRLLLNGLMTLFRRQANTFSEILRRRWHIDASLSDLPVSPRWIMNAVSYETGRSWRFEKKRLGDHQFGYVLDPNLSLADAIAASAAFPFWVGPYVLDTTPYQWVRYIDEKTTESITVPLTKVHLWDGGIYDNLGVEAFMKPSRGFRPGIDRVIVSDASQLKDISNYSRRQTLERLITLAVDQNKSLYTRQIMAHITADPDSGYYFKLGNDCAYVLSEALARGKDHTNIEQLAAKCLSKVEIDTVAKLPSTKLLLSKNEFDCLFRHGFEVANYTLYGYHSKQFQFLQF